jgi:PLP dependent protein
MTDPAHNLKTILSDIHRSAVDVGRDPDAITLIAVSKTHPCDAIRPVLDAGYRVFGENYVQEAKAKWVALREELSDLDLHLIGPLQSNKAKEAVALFSCIHTLDRASLAVSLAREIDRQGRCPKLFVQVNTGEEPQKGGVFPAQLDAFLGQCRREWHLPIAGLMAIPPAEDPPSPHFAFLARMAKDHGLTDLSMGMSADYRQAIALGATHVRVGSAIFGERASAIQA